VPGRIGEKKVGNDKGLPAITCSVCGEEIMIVPNVKLTSAAIEAHVETHKQKIKDRKAAEEEAERIRDNLITQVLEKASKRLKGFSKNKKKNFESQDGISYCLFSPPLLIISGILAEALDIASLTTSINSSLTSSSTVIFNLPFLSLISVMEPPPEPT
jgi:hypothetical protein